MLAVFALFGGVSYLFQWTMISVSCFAAALFIGFCFNHIKGMKTIFEGLGYVVAIMVIAIGISTLEELRVEVIKILINAPTIVMAVACISVMLNIGAYVSKKE